MVQMEPEPADLLTYRLRSVLDPWLGQAQWKQSRSRVTLGYRFWSEDVPAMRLRLKVEINTREHSAVLAFTKREFRLDSRWHTGRVDITTFELDELLATKLRALYQRRKGRDLFDLANGLDDKAMPERSWRHSKNIVQPHRSLGNMPPSVFARKVA